MMQWIRFLLWPFGFMYAGLTTLRNALYSTGILSSWEAPGPVICVGNLSTGGTGKTPHVIHLAEYLGKTSRVGILSRGYGRRSKGFRWVKESDSWRQVGDEPLEIALRVPGAVVAVCEDRKEGLRRLFGEGRVDVVIMDDGFQHRAVRPGFNILLTPYHQPFYRDAILPVGNLREAAGGYRRAQYLLITKTPPHAPPLTLPDYITLPYAYSKNRYAEPVCPMRDEVKNLAADPAPTAPPKSAAGRAAKSSEKSTQTPFDELKNSGVIAVSAIADPSKFLSALQPELRILAARSWRDHHPFSQSDVKKIAQTAQRHGAPIITTMKDYIRLKEVWKGHGDRDLWVLPQAIEPLPPEFYEEINNYVTRTKRS